jgi:poly-gamma-glutamate synthesis protein (capsule biosynthesis protein)
VLAAKQRRLAVLAASDHPADFAAATDRAGIAYADLRADPFGGWLAAAVKEAARHADAVLVTPHWGPNMTARPTTPVRRAARELVGAGASLVAGHSAHVPHGAHERVLFDLGDFVDDYAADEELRSDLGLLFLVDLDPTTGPRRLEAIPLKLDFCHTRIATGADADWIRRRFIDGCEELGTTAAREEERVVVTWR